MCTYVHSLHNKEQNYFGKITNTYLIYLHFETLLILILKTSNFQYMYPRMYPALVPNTNNIMTMFYVKSIMLEVIRE